MSIRPMGLSPAQAVAAAAGTFQPVDHRWAAGLAVKTGQIIENAGTLYKATADFTTPGSFNTTNLTALSGGGGGGGDLLAANNLSDLASAATARTNLGLGTAATHAHGDYQPADADLTTIAALDSATAGALVTDGSGWIRKTYAQLKTALSLVKGDVGLGNVDNTSDASKPVSTATQTALDAKAPLVESVNTVATSGTTQTVPDPNTSSMNDITLSANCTITLPSPGAGKSFLVLVRQDGTGSRTLAWSGSVVWDGGSAPTQASAASAATEYVFASYSGSTWRGKLAGSYAT